MARPDYTTKLRRSGPPALLVLLNLFLFGAATLYRGNTQEFSFGFLDLLWQYAQMALAGLVLLVGPGVLLSLKRLSVYTSLVFGVGLLLWLQGNLLVWDYGVFDGRGIDWQAGSWRGWVDGVLWCAVIVAAVVWHQRVSRISSFVSWVLISLQAVLFSIAAVGSPGAFQPASPDHGLPKGLGAYSSGFNIVHLVFDGLQTDVFEEVVARNRLADDLEGFVLYRENMTVFGNTAFALPAIFGGDVYPGDIEAADFIRESLCVKGFQNRLLDRGYRVNLVAAIHLPVEKYTNYYKIPAVYGTRQERRAAEAGILLDLVLFRHLPHVLKKVIRDDDQGGRLAPALAGSWKAGYFHHKEFLRDYFAGLHTTGTGPAYHFIHIDPPHPPFVTAPDCSYVGHGLDQTRDNYKIEVECVLRLFVRGLERLKALGLYRSALIIVQADTGQGYPPAGLKGTFHRVPPETVGRSLALLAVKQPNARGPMQVSNAQTSLIDVPATVMKVAGQPGGYRGSPLDEIDPATDRVRVYSNRYRVRGSVYDPGSWEVVEAEPVRLEAPVYRPGSVIRFGYMGNAMPYQAGGWSSPEDGFTWTNGHRASLLLPIENPGKMLVLQARVKPMRFPDRVDRQRVELLVNGRRAGRQVVGHPGRLSFEIPGELLGDSNQLELTFALPDAASAFRLGLGNDRRLLGLAFYQMRLKAIP